MKDIRLRVTLFLNIFYSNVRSNPTLRVSTKRNGAISKGGQFQLSFEGQRTQALAHDISAEALKSALESLTTIGKVDVNQFTNNNGHNYFVTFLSELGNLSPIAVDDSQLNGPNAKIIVTTIKNGVLPSKYDSVFVDQSSRSLRINNLLNGKKYIVQVRSMNSEGLGDFSLAMQSPISPKEAPSSPINVQIFALSDTFLRVSWDSPNFNGGDVISQFKVQWDVDSQFRNQNSPGFQQILHVTNNSDDTFCYDISIDLASKSVKRYARVLAYNGHTWSDPQISLPHYSTASKLPPGEVQNLKAISASITGILVSWDFPSTQNSCRYGGDGGSPITNFLIEWSENNDFDPAHSAMVSSSIKEYMIGGKDTITGAKSDALKEGGKYFVRVMAINSIGPSDSDDISTVSVGPLTDSSPNAPIVNNDTSIYALSGTSLMINWNTPLFDGGEVVERYAIEYDTSSNFTSSTQLEKLVISEKQMIDVESTNIIIENQVFTAAVDVTNEQQLVRSTALGMDEIQTVTTTSDDVIAEVQTVTTTAVDSDEVQQISIVGDDIDEIQLLRIYDDDIPEVQNVKIVVDRINEVQYLGIIIENINTDDGCIGVNINERCLAIEESLSGKLQ